MTLLLVAKLLLTPLLMALVTLAERRYAGRAAGLLAGLPLTSGPVLVFLTVQEGSAFAARAAVGTLLGLISVTAFAVGYGFAAARSPWTVALPVGLITFGIATWDMRRLSPAPVQALGVVLLVLLLALVALPESPGAPAAANALPSRVDLFVRMAVATAIVLAITFFAPALGPQLSGLLAPFPVFMAILAVLSHRSGGRVLVVRTLRGILVGIFGAAAFFAIVAGQLPRLPAVPVYALASLAAVLAAGLAFSALKWKEGRSV